MRYILHSHRRTEHVDASLTLWLTTKMAVDSHILSPFQHFQITFDSSPKHDANILNFDPRTDTRKKQTTSFRSDATV